MSARAVRRLISRRRQEFFFKDVAGQEEAKESLQEVVDFLHNPGKYTQIGAKLPKGAAACGTSGNRIRLFLPMPVAGEANVPFFSLSGSEFVEMFVGVRSFQSSRFV